MASGVLWECAVRIKPAKGEMRRARSTTSLPRHNRAHLQQDWMLCSQDTARQVAQLLAHTWREHKTACAAVIIFTALRDWQRAALNPKLLKQDVSVSTGAWRRPQQRLQSRSG